MSESVNLSSRVTLNDGNEMPLFGLGTSLIDGTAEVCLEALKLGYRLLDSAAYYENEAQVGEAVRKSGLDRKDVFVCTKLHFDHHGAEKTRLAIEKSLKVLDLGYIDLYLIHSPSGGKILETYDVLVEYQKKGLLRSIGVSNFNVHHLKGLAEAGRPKPAVNQIELHCWQRKEAVVQYCRDHDIALMGFAPIAKAQRMDDPVVRQIASRLNKTHGQVMIRWSVQSGYITIPKTSNVKRLSENADVFDCTLSEEDMAALITGEEFQSCRISSSTQSGARNAVTVHPDDQFTNLTASYIRMNYYIEKF